MLDTAPAQLIYEPADFEVVRPGRFVLCAVTGVRIPLDQLKYWSVAYQEAYVGAAESLRAAEAGGAAKLKG